jgi:hypothetical protein
LSTIIAGHLWAAKSASQAWRSFVPRHSTPALEDAHVLLLADEFGLGLLEHHLVAELAGLIANARDQLAEVRIGERVPQGRQHDGGDVGVTAAEALRQPIGLIPHTLDKPLNAEARRAADARVAVKDHADGGDRDFAFFGHVAEGNHAVAAGARGRRLWRFGIFFDFGHAAFPLGGRLVLVHYHSCLAIKRATARARLLKQFNKPVNGRQEKNPLIGGSPTQKPPRCGRASQANPASDRPARADARDIDGPVKIFIDCFRGRCRLQSGRCGAARRVSHADFGFTSQNKRFFTRRVSNRLTHPRGLSDERCIAAASAAIAQERFLAGGRGQGCG